MELSVAALQQRVEHGQRGPHQEAQCACVALRQEGAGSLHADVSITGWEDGEWWRGSGGEKGGEGDSTRLHLKSTQIGHAQA